MMLKTPVFVMKDNPDQLGSGYYRMTACFVKLGVHVPYVFFAHSENEYLEERKVGRPTVCDGSCKDRRGGLKDFPDERHHTDYNKAPIIERAKEFAKQLKEIKKKSKR